MNIPKGYVLVPVDPDEKMIRKGDMNYSWSVAKIYKAMIASAPPVELPAYEEAKERELFCFWSSTHEYLGGCTLHTGTDGLFADVDLQCAWESWKACAKSRARSAE